MPEMRVIMTPVKSLLQECRWGMKEDCMRCIWYQEKKIKTVSSRNPRRHLGSGFHWVTSWSCKTGDLCICFCSSAHGIFSQKTRYFESSIQHFYEVCLKTAWSNWPLQMCKQHFILGNSATRCTVSCFKNTNTVLPEMFKALAKK